VSDDIDTTAVDAAISTQRTVRTRIGAVLKLIDQAMDAPEGAQWEHEVSTPEDLTPEPEAPRSSTALQEREQRLRDQFTRNWPDKPKRK
jgi:hypothetical protein